MMLDQLLYHVVPFRVVMATATAQSTVVKLAATDYRSGLSDIHFSDIYGLSSWLHHEF